MNTEPSEREEGPERLKQIRDGLRRVRRDSSLANPGFAPPLWDDIDFLLSLLDSQAAERDALRDSASLVAFQAHQIDGRIATSLINRAREQCAKRVRAYLTDCRDDEMGIIEAIASDLESLTLEAAANSVKDSEPEYGARFGQYSTDEEASAIDEDDD